MPLHRHLTRDGARRLFPSLRADAVTGAIRYYDGQVDDARLVVNLARTAASLGAAVVTSARVIGFVREAREVVGVRVRDLEAPGRARVRGPRPHGGRRHRRVERRHVADAQRRRRPPRPAGPRLQGRAPGGAALGDHRRGRADPAHAHLGAVRHPVGRPLDHRHHRHRLAPRPVAPGRLGARHPLPARPGQHGAGPAADHRRHRGRLRRAAPAAVRRGRLDLEAVPRARGGRADARAAAGGRRQVHDVPGDGGGRDRPGGAPARRSVARRRAPISCRCSARTATPPRGGTGRTPPAGTASPPGWSSTCSSGTAR